MVDKDMPCKQDCPDRVVGCHGKCSKYQSWKEKHIEKKIKIWRSQTNVGCDSTRYEWRKDRGKCRREIKSYKKYS